MSEPGSRKHRFGIRDLFAGAPVIRMEHRADCTQLMREYLTEGIWALDIILMSEWPYTKKQFRSITKDSGASTPTEQDIQNEAWGPWCEALWRQLEKATNSQIARYYFEFMDPNNTGEIGCPEGCGGEPEVR